MTVDPRALADVLVREARLWPLTDGRPTVGGRSFDVHAIGWATVDLERAAASLVPGPPASAPLGRPVRAESTPGAPDADLPDELLGAVARIVAGPPGGPSGGPSLVLLEPSREGRLAAVLARRGEGPAVLYLAAGRLPLAATVAGLAATGLRTRTGSGPFGEAALVLDRPLGGPQLVVVAVPSGP